MRLVIGHLKSRRVLSGKHRGLRVEAELLPERQHSVKSDCLIYDGPHSVEMALGKWRLFGFEEMKNEARLNVFRLLAREFGFRRLSLTSFHECQTVCHNMIRGKVTRE